MSKNTFLKIKIIVLIVGVFLLYGMLYSSPSRAYIPQLQQSGETLIAHFANGPNAVTSQQEYSGLVTINVSGLGQASSTQVSDAFYLRTDFSGNRITPVHPTVLYNWVLWINGQHAENLIPGQQVPAYQGTGEYTFQINAPGGYLTFGVGDVGTGDNTGSYTIQINSPPSNSIPFFAQKDPQWEEHPLRTGGLCHPTDCDTIGECGCTLTSAAMLFAYYGANLTPLTLSDCMGISACPFAFSTASSRCSDNQATWVTIYGSRDGTDWNWGRLDHEINQEGHPVILEMYPVRDTERPRHWVLVTSGHGNNASDYLAHDPGSIQGADTTLSTFERAGYRFSRLAIYNGQPGTNSVPMVMFNQNVASTQTNQSNKYQFSGASATPVPNIIANTPTPITQDKLVNITPVTNSISTMSISGTVSIYHLYETTLIVQLSATSTFGSIVELQIWTDSIPAQQWEPFNTHTWVSWAPEDNRVYVRFRDEFGNVSDDYSTSIFPEFGPPLIREIFLPIILKSQ